MDGGKPSGIEPLIAALTESVLGASKALMPRSIGPNGAWRAILAWMTRDQECRFGRALDWRSSDSDSHSPVVNREDRLLIVRAAIGALSAAEMSALAEEEKQATEVDTLKARQVRLEWQVENARQNIAESLSDAPMDIDIWKAKAAERLAAALNIPGRARAGDVQAMRRGRDAAKEELNRLTGKDGDIENRIATKEQLVTIIRNELPEAYAELRRKSGLPNLQSSN